MNKTLRTLLASLTLLCLSVVGASAQTTLTQTTLSAALAAPAQGAQAQTVTVASSTGLTAGSMLYFQQSREAALITAVSGTTATVQRAYDGTVAGAAASASVVYVGTPQQFQFQTFYGACTRSANLVIPFIVVQTGVIQDCVNGRWVALNTTPSAVPATYGWRQIAQNGSAGAGDLITGAAGYTVVDSDYIIALRTTAKDTAAVAIVNSITLPNANQYPGRVLVIKDESGGITATTKLLLIGTVNGTANYSLASGWAGVTIYAGSNGWFTFGCSSAGISC